MAEQARTPKFSLKTAKGLIDEVAGQTEDVVQLQRLAHDEKRFWEGLKMTWKVGGEVGRLQNDLALAIELATKAATADQDVCLDDGTTPDKVIAQAHFQGGLIEFRSGNWNEALQSFEKAQNIIPMQEALFNIALCQLNMIRRFDPLAGFKNPIKGYEKRLKLLTPWKKGALKEAREGFGLTQAFVSGNYSQQEIIATFNRAIDMDPESDLAVEAGKILVRLER
jgi:tetratricopeptide (TPR) repeat protein